MLKEKSRGVRSLIRHLYSVGVLGRSFHPVVPQIGDRWSAKEARAGTPFAASSTITVTEVRYT